MWNTDTIWFEVAIVSTTFALGHILLGHFEERTPRIRKLLKYLIVLGLVIALSVFLSRQIALIIYGVLHLPVLYIHLIDLPRRGINGWTGKPRSRYYELRGWDKDIFRK